jgi:cell cycle checkpoint control protein RAD9A
MKIQATATMSSGRHFQVSGNQSADTNNHPGLSVRDGEHSYTIPTQRLAPTQNVSEVRGSPLNAAEAPLTLSRSEDCLIKDDESNHADKPLTSPTRRRIGILIPLPNTYSC